MPPSKKPNPRRKAPPTSKRTKTHVTSHERKTKTGVVWVADHDRNISTGKTKAAWAGAGMSGLTALGLTLQLGFTILSATALILAALVAMITYLLTGQDVGPKPRRRRSTRTRRPTTGKRPARTRRR